MALLTESEARAAARTYTTRVNKAAASVLREAVATTQASFDIFLSHSRLDAEIVVGVKAILESTGQSVYVDWLDDPNLDRANVTPATAEKIRARMRQSRSLMYAHSGNASKSRWMPWELGYFDGFNGNVAILPIVQNANEAAFKGEEFLGIYPYVDITGRSLSSPGTIYIHRDRNKYLNLRDWRGSSDKLRPAL